MNTTELNGKKYQMQTQEDGNILLVEIKEPKPEQEHRNGDVYRARELGVCGSYACAITQSGKKTHQWHHADGAVKEISLWPSDVFLCNIFDLAARFPEGFDVDDLCLKSEVRAALSHEDHWGDSLLGLLFSPDYLTNAWGRMFARNALRDLGIITDKD